MISHKLKARFDRFFKAKEEADMTTVKLKLVKRCKHCFSINLLGKKIVLFNFHLYRKPLLGLVSNIDDIFGDRDDYEPYTDSEGKHCVSWGEWKARIKKACPIQYYLREDLDMDLWRFFRVRQIKDAWYYLKCKLFKKYNVIKIDTLPPTWADESTLIVHGMFAILKRFMDQQPDEHVDYQSDPLHEQFWKDINEAWAWWNKRDEREAQMNAAYALSSSRKGRDIPYLEKYAEVHALETQFKQEEEDMLIKIIKNREGLWI